MSRPALGQLRQIGPDWRCAGGSTQIGGRASTVNIPLVIAMPIRAKPLLVQCVGTMEAGGQRRAGIASTSFELPGRSACAKITTVGEVGREDFNEDEGVSAEPANRTVLRRAKWTWLERCLGARFWDGGECGRVGPNSKVYGYGGRIALRRPRPRFGVAGEA